MTSAARARALCLSLAAVPLLLAQDPTPGRQAVKHPLRIAFVGDPASARTAAFVDFLRAHFAAADAFGRAGADLGAVQQRDVVLLDWGQSDEAREQRAAGSSPLGTRDGWHTPTVLLGSAGLNLAGAWQVRGGFG